MDLYWVARPVYCYTGLGIVDRKVQISPLGRRCYRYPDGMRPGRRWGTQRRHHAVWRGCGGARASL